jgi:hypothetical protein
MNQQRKVRAMSNKPNPFRNLPQAEREILLEKLLAWEYEDMPISTEEIVEWVVTGLEEKRLRRERGETEPFNPAIEMVRRQSQWEASMKDPMIRPVQERLNFITNMLQIYREGETEFSVRDIASRLGLEAATMRCIEKGYTDATELAGIVEAWAEVLGLDGKAIKNTIPGQQAGRNIF